MSLTRRSFFGRLRRQSKRRNATNRSRRRLAHLERLEDRVLLAADVNLLHAFDNPWHNRLVPGDVDGDFRVTPLDALIVINSLNREGPRRLDTLLFSGNSGGEGEATSATPPPIQMLDVNNDGYLSPIDALQIINLLNQGEGETPQKLVRAEAVVTEYLRPDYLGDQPVNRPRIDTANPGDTILVNVFAADIREDDGTPGDTDEFGIFAAYFDFHFDPLAFTVPSGPSIPSGDTYPDFPISFINPAHRTSHGSILDKLVATAPLNYPNGPSGILSQAEGRIYEVGGFSWNTAEPLGRDISPPVPQDDREIFLNLHVFDVPFDVESLYAMDETAEVDAGSWVQINVLEHDGLIEGPYSFNLTGASGVGNEILTYGDNSAITGDTGREAVVPEENVLFVSGTIEIPKGNRELTYEGVISGPSNGKVSPADGQSNGLLIYTPESGFSGTDSFVYRVSDGTNRTKDATVTITVNPLNEPPQITAPEAVAFDEDTVLIFTEDNSVTITDAEGDPLDVTLVASSPITVADGSGVTFTDDGSDKTLEFSGTPEQVQAALAGLTYTPAPNFYGSGQLVITASDNINDPVSHTIDLTVRPINDPPSLSGVPDTVQTLQIDELPWTLDTIRVSDDLDAEFAPEGDVVNRLTLQVTGGTLTVPDHAEVEVTGSGTDTVMIEGMTAEINLLLEQGVAFDGPVGEVTFTANLNDLGNVDWRGEEAALEDEKSFVIMVVPPTRPFAANDSFTVHEDSGPTVFDVLQNDYNYDSQQGGENLQIDAITQPENGSVAIVTEGTAVVYTPEHDYFGTDTFTYTIIDTENLEAESSTATVTVNVLAVNDPPSFTAADPEDVLEDAGLKEIEGWVTDFVPGPPNESDQDVLEYIVSDITNPDLFEVEPQVSPVGTLIFQSAPDAFGSSEFTVVVRDDGGTERGGIDTSEPQTFTITVLAVNDPPTFTASDPPVIHEDAGSQEIENWATDFVPGPPNESDQKLVGYDVIEVTNEELFAELPEVDLDGTLTYTPAADAFGTATFTVVAQDDGGTAHGGRDTSDPQTFTIEILPVNDPPSFVAADPPEVPEDAGRQVIEVWVTDFIPGPPNESDQEVLEYHVTEVSNEALFAELPSVSLDGTLTYESAPDVWGTSTFTVVVQDDGGTERGGQDMSEPQTFTITVLAVNDPPVNRVNGEPIDPDVQLFTNNDFDLAFTAANQARLTVTDVDDDGSETYSVQLSVTHGELLFGLEDEPAASKEISARSLAAVNEKLGTLIFRPAEGFIGDAELTIASNDGGTFGEGPEGGWTTEDTLVISVAPLNRPPIAADDEIEMDEGDVALFSVFDDNGHGPDSAGPNEDDFQSIQVISFDTTDTMGTVVLLDEETGEFRYTPPDEYWNGVTSFTYKIQDDGQSMIDGEIVDDFKTDSATVTITVWEVNNAPIAEDDLVLIDPQPEAGQEFIFLASELLANDLPGPPNEFDQTLRIVSVSTSDLGATVTLVPGDTGDPGDDQIIYTVPAGFEHVDTFEYTVQDDGTTRGQPDPQTDTATVTVRDVVLSTLSGYVYVDPANGGQPTSQRLGGVLIQLTGTDLMGNSVYEETRTAEDGSYAFTDVMPSREGTEYLITQQQPIGWRDGYVSPGNHGAEVRGENVIGIHLPLIGLDSANPDQSESSHNNFAEFGVSAQYGLITLRDLLYSGNENNATGWVFATDADNQLQWYMNLGGWEGYTPGVASGDASGVYTVNMSGDSFAVTNRHLGQVEQLQVNSLARFRQSTHEESGSTITHLIGSPHHFDLLNGVEDPLADSDLDLLALGEGEADYSAAVDAVFADLL